MGLAGAVSNLSFSWIDGVTGDQVSEGDEAHSSGARGSWRSHMNALQSIVEDNLGSALILEDDIDWDVRLKSQLRTFASASKTWLKESKSNKGEIVLADLISPSYVRKRSGRAAETQESKRDTTQMKTAMRTDNKVHQSAYGNGWDILWLGHCGADFPDFQKPLVPPLIVTIPEDETVPAPKHLKPHPFALLDKLGWDYAAHTRAVHASSGNVCSLAYAVSQEGARKLLSEFNAHYDAQWDLMLQKWCEGGYNSKEEITTDYEGESDSVTIEDHGADTPVCLTVQPPLFSHYYAKGGTSNIQSQGGGYSKGTGTPYIRLSVRKNLGRLATGAPLSEMVDQLPDDGEPIWK